VSEIDRLCHQYPLIAIGVRWCQNLIATSARYVHRVGRTGRMGKAGVSFLMLTKSERGFLELLAAIQVKTNIACANFHGRNAFDCAFIYKCVCARSVA
jgi:hypothetical protein